MRITIKDVASAAGVSVGTASYALNGTGPVSQEKLQRVQEAAKKLGYVPNGIARSLQAQSHGVVGYFAYSLSGPFFGQIMKGIENSFLDSDEEMIACSCSSEKKNVTRFLRERMVDGAIVFGEHLEDELIQLIAGAGCPVVVMDREICNKYISSITIDNETCAYEVGKYIHDQGFRKVGCILGNGPDGTRREAGFRKAVAEFALELDQNALFCGDFQYDVALERATDWLETKPELPEVLFAFNDEMAIAAIHALNKAGYRVPEDISVIGMDDIPQSAYMSPSLTTYHLPIYEHGVMAAERLLEMLRENKDGSAASLTGHMVERKSCRKKNRQEQMI